MAKKIGNNDALQAAIADLLNRPDLEKPSDDWRTVLEWAKVIGMGKTQTLAKVNRLVKSGEWEKQSFHKKDNVGIYKAVPYYRKKP